MGIVKFKTGYSADKIQQVEVLRETEACVYLPTNALRKGGRSERREAKQSAYDHYHDSWADAYAYLLKKAEGKVEGAQFQLEHANKHLDSIKGMTAPEDAS